MDLGIKPENKDKMNFKEKRNPKIVKAKKKGGAQGTYHGSNIPTQINQF